MNLLLLDPNEVTSSGTAVLTDRRARHVFHVLRAEPGRTIRIGVIDGPLGTATVRDITPAAVTIACEFDATAPPRPRLDLLLALPRPKVLQRLWAQLAALGVGRIILTNAARVERNYFDTHILDEAVYRPLLLEGLQQARDTQVPVVSVFRQFRILVEDHLDTLCPQTRRFIADPDVPDRPRTVGADLRTAAPGAPDDDRQLLAIGPEGGWNDFERGLLEARGFQRFSLGPRALRSDTACIALVSVLTMGSASEREPG